MNKTQVKLIAIRKLLEMQEGCSFLPKESAPRDGTWILCWDGRGSQKTTGLFPAAFLNGAFRKSPSAPPSDIFTHWLPLPSVLPNGKSYNEHIEDSG